MLRPHCGADALEASLALVVRHSTCDELLELRKLKARCPSLPVFRIAGRRLYEGCREAAKVAPFANVPDDVRLYVCNENVQSLAIGKNFVFAGMPWGVAVYGRDGRMRHRIALAEPAWALLVVGQDLFVGGETGLFRVDLPTFEVTHIPIDATLRWRHGPVSHGHVEAMAAWGSYIAVGFRVGLVPFDPGGPTLKTLPLQDFSGLHWNRLLPDGDHLWVPFGAPNDHRLLRIGDEGATVTPVCLGNECNVRLVAKTAEGVFGTIRTAPASNGLSRVAIRLWSRLQPGPAASCTILGRFLFSSPLWTCNPSSAGARWLRPLPSLGRRRHFPG